MSERASPAYIDYKMTVTIKRGVLRVNQTYVLSNMYSTCHIKSFRSCRLGTSFVYLPRSRANPPSPLREAAYREGVPLIGPESDPVGWKVLQPVKIKGTIFDTREVEVECTVRICCMDPTQYLKLPGLFI
jgi:hypothetical protein